MNGSKLRTHSPSDADTTIDESSAPSLLPFQPLVEAWDMLSSAAIVKLRWTAARLGADGLVPLALRETLETRPCNWLAHR